VDRSARGTETKPEINQRWGVILTVFRIWIKPGQWIQEGKNDPQKQKKKLRNFMFLSAGCFLLRAEGFICSLDVLYGGLGIGLTFFSAVNIFHFGHQNPGTGLVDWTRIRVSPKC
jgi:hypothetical protein